METSDSIGQGTIQRLESLFPKNDEFILKAMVRVGVDKGGGYSNHWNTPVVASRHGWAYISPEENNWRFEFKPWGNITKLKKGAQALTGLDQVKGEIFFKTKRGAFGRIYFQVMREGNESRSEFKQRKKEFRNTIPQLYKSAKSAQLFSKPTGMIFRGAGGIGEPISVMGSPGGFEQSTPAAPQGTDADLFPGFSQGSTAPTSQSLDFGTPAPSQETESFDEDWDDDWFEEEQPAPAQAQPAPPQTDFLPEKQPTSDDSKEEDFEWDEWED
jgi:hypothetical protein